MAASPGPQRTARAEEGDFEIGPGEESVSACRGDSPYPEKSCERRAKIPAVGTSGESGKLVKLIEPFGAGSAFRPSILPGPIPSPVRSHPSIVRDPG